MSRLKMLVFGCVFVPGVALGQVDFQQPPADPGTGMHPKERNKAEMMERLKKARDADSSSKLESRRERLRQSSRLRTNGAHDAEFRKHFKRVARIMRISEIATETGNEALAARAKTLLTLESARHRRVMKRQVRTAP